MANNAPISNKKYRQGKYPLKNPEKYKGDVNNVIYRSSWEKRVMIWFDNNPSVLYWNSEGVIVPYFSPVDKKPHRYYIDFIAQVKTKSGDVKTYAIEVKPKKETEPPTTKNKKALLEATITYAINQAKWKAAKEFFDAKGIRFIVLTEDDLKISR